MRTILQGTLTTVAAAGLLLAGCSKNDGPGEFPGQSTKISAITVRAEGFVSPAAPRSADGAGAAAACDDAGTVYPRAAIGASAEQSRATDIGYNTMFDQGDRIGLTAVKADGTFLQNNMMLTYGSDGVWSLPADGNLWYLANVEYIAYYPYDEAMGAVIAGAADKTGAGIRAAIIAAFSPRADQSSYAAYTASDLMLWSGVANNSGAAPQLDIALEHAMSLIIVEPRGAEGYTAPAGAEWVYHDAAAYQAPSNVNISVTVGGVKYTPYAMLGAGNSTAGETPGEVDGTWRVLIKPAAAAVIAVEYELPGTAVGWTSPAGSLAPNAAQYKKYNVNPPAALSSGERAAQVGDFYYMAADAASKAMILPKDMMTEALKAGCSGVVAVVSGGISGTILQKDQGEGLAWSTIDEVTQADNADDGQYNMDMIKGLPSWQADNNTYPAFKWCAGNGEGWYIPSKSEFIALIDACLSFNPSLEAAGGTACPTDGRYWIGLESSQISAIIYHEFGMMEWGKATPLSVRAIRSF